MANNLQKADYNNYGFSTRLTTNLANSHVSEEAKRAGLKSQLSKYRQRGNQLIGSSLKTTMPETKVNVEQHEESFERVEFSTPNQMYSRKQPKTKPLTMSPQIKPQLVNNFYSPEGRNKKGASDFQHMPRVGSAAKPDHLSKLKILKTVSPTSESSYRFSISPGNNSEVVRRAMMTRPWWTETQGYANMSNFIWQPTSRGLRFDRLRATNAFRQIVNHFEFHREITCKTGLLKNLQEYCDKQHAPIHNLTPLTVIIDLESDNIEMELQNFAEVFKACATNSSGGSASKEVVIPPKFIDSKYKYINLRGNMTFENQRHNYLNLSGIIQAVASYPTFHKGQNLWLLKPADYNRGRGIQLFNDLTTLKKYINEQYALIAEEKNQNNMIDSLYKKSYHFANNSAKRSIGHSGAEGFVKSDRFVVQKYIESPLTILTRKFDIRVWVMLNYDMCLYFFKEGYLRMSCESFAMDEASLQNKYVHLTNNAIQKNSDKYGKFESGNQLSFGQFERHLRDKKANANFKGYLLPRMKELVRTSMSSVKHKLNQYDRKFCFEIFGYDFIIDSDFNVWLIEVNTNPCLEESSPLLESLIPRMINDGLKLSIDALFPKPAAAKQNYSSGMMGGKSYDLINPKSDGYPRASPTMVDVGSVAESATFPVQNYRDEENMWELIDNFGYKTTPQSFGMNTGQNFRVAAT